jgi:hypothetical protein
MSRSYSSDGERLGYNEMPLMLRGSEFVKTEPRQRSLYNHAAACNDNCGKPYCSTYPQPTYFPDKGAAT